MSEQAVVHGDEPPSWWPKARWAVLALSILMLAVFAVEGNRQSSYAEFQDELRQGNVTQVRIEGGFAGPEGLDPGAQGVATVRVFWDAGWPTRVTRIWQATSQSELNSVTLAGADADAVVIGPIDAALREVSPDVTVTWAEQPERSVGAFFGRWELPGPWFVLPFVLLAGFILELARGPEPRWATRWAWAWLSLTPVLVVVVPVYLVFGARPHLPGHRRLTGGWAFLLTLIIFNALGVASPL